MQEFLSNYREKFYYRHQKLEEDEDDGDSDVYYMIEAYSEILEYLQK